MEIWLVMFVAAAGRYVLGDPNVNHNHYELKHTAINPNFEWCLAINIPKSQIYSQISNSKEYEVLRFSQNNRISRFPNVIVSVNKTSDVSAAIKCAKVHNVTQIVARSGGHSYEGYSTCNGCLLIDLRYMDNLHVDAKSSMITSQVGTLLGHLNYQLWTQYGIVIPSGSCAYVGLGGYVLGGGYGYLSRKLGLLADSVAEITMVNHEGEVIVANQTTNEDLYWAHRGAGGGHFGVVTDVKIQGHRGDFEDVVHFAIHYDINHFKEAVFWLEQNAWTAPRELGFELVVEAYNQYIEIKGYFFGTETDLQKWMSRSKIRKFAPTLMERIFKMDYVSYLLHAGFLPNNPSILRKRFPHSPKSPFKHVSAVSKRPISFKMLNEIEQKLQELPWEDIDKAGSGVFLIFAPYGGKIAELNDTATAFPHRENVRFMMQLGFYWSDEIQTKQNVESVMKWQREARSILMQDFDGAYRNYADEGLSNHLQDYYGNNVARLKKIKKKYDPNNMFNFEQSIPTS